ncbi:hypothetical protein [Mumia sp. Pv 4-285]|uniref:hypothetical protein n=1 Tax=Mumia qirimensis TaxID=3234852 RepID=UPI00351D6255
MPRLRTLISTLAAVLLGATLVAPLGAAGAASAATPAASLQVPSSTGTIGRFDSSAIVTVKQKCDTGLVVQELQVDVTQGAVTGSRSGTFGAVCDGAWHALKVEVGSSTGDEYVPGAVAVTARFTVLDPVTMDPLPQAVAQGTVTLLPQVELKLGEEGSVGQFETVRIPILYRCDSPWIVSELALHVRQGDLHGDFFTDQGFRCDGAWHHRTIVMSSTTGAPFEPGYADIEASLNIQDPQEFDPVGQSQVFSRLWIAPAARAVVNSAVRNPDSSVTVTMSLRCQRPWIVGDWGASVAQNEGRIYGFAARTTGVVCDQTWKKVSIRVIGSSPFVKGPAEVSASISLYDPVHFDPVGAGGDTAVIQLR